MAKIIFAEDDPIAIKAMEGIIKRSPHQLINVKSGDAALNLLSRDMSFDLIIAELKLEVGSFVKTLKQIRSNPFLRPIPILIYTKIKDKDIIRTTLNAGVQNLLFKPFKDKQIIEEIEKALAANWRFEKGANKKFFDKLSAKPSDFLKQNHKLTEEMVSLEEAIMADKSPQGVMGEDEWIEHVAVKARHLGYPLLNEILTKLLEEAEEGTWSNASKLIDYLPLAKVMQQYRITYIEKGLSKEEPSSSGEADVAEVVDAEAPEAEEVAPEKGKWTKEAVFAHIDAMQNYPVIESSAAAFQMMVNDDDANLDELVETIQRDAGLAAAILKFSNSGSIAPGQSIEDIHQAISVLGLSRVRLLAISLKTMPDMSALFTAFRWQDFWMHQVGCAILAEKIATMLELPGRHELVYLSGLVHDIGKILLCDIDGDAYRAAVLEAQAKRRSLRDCEREYFGVSHDEAALHYAKSGNLADVLQTSIACQFAPHQATTHMEVVAPLSLSIYLCLKDEIGCNGDHADPNVATLSGHPTWDLMGAWLPPAFSKTRFHKEIEDYITTMKRELHGMAKEHELKADRAKS